MNVISVIKVGIADLNTAISPNVLKTTGLGSCVGVALYDKTTKVAGLAHVMLPSSDMMKGEDGNKMKYADTALSLLLNEMRKKGAQEREITAKLAGGAQMFKFSTAMDSMRIGPRNIDACKAFLSERNIAVLAEDTGGNMGRTIEMSAETGILTVRTINQGVIEL